MSAGVWAAATLVGLLAGLGALVGAAVSRPTRPCRTCRGIGSQRGRRGRWAGHCAVCRGSGQRDGLALRVLVALTRGRVLPRAGSAATGRMHGRGYVFAGRSPGGEWRAAPDPPDSRLVALERRRVPAARRLVERRRAAYDRARGLARLWAWARLGAARRRARRAQRAADAHALAIDDRAAGYRRTARQRPAPRRR